MFINGLWQRNWICWVINKDFYTFCFHAMIVMAIPSWIEFCKIILGKIIFYLIAIVAWMMIMNFLSVRLIIIWMVPELFIFLKEQSNFVSEKFILMLIFIQYTLKTEQMRANRARSISIKSMIVIVSCTHKTLIFLIIKIYNDLAFYQPPFICHYEIFIFYLGLNIVNNFNHWALPFFYWINDGLNKKIISRL